MRNFSKSIIVGLFISVFLSGPLAGHGALQPIQDEAGFIRIEPITFYFHYGSYFNRLQLTSSDAQIWYSFHAADEDAENKPLFVFFNGGPGSATSSGLLSMYTAPYTLDNSIDSGGGEEFIQNPVPWTRLGNLIHIDARQTGFSYNTMDSVHDTDRRFREFNAQNFNPFFDAADFIRVLLRFLAHHPEIRDNKVVIVGESYGGTRATTLLHLLLNYADYGNGNEMYQDSALTEEIQNHYNIVFPGYNNQRVPPETIIGQFGHQVLIQPAVTMTYQWLKRFEMVLQPGSVIDQLGQDTGIPYDPAVHGNFLNYVMEVINRDVYMYSKPKDWLLGFFYNAGRLLQKTGNLSLVSGTDVTGIPGLYASSRDRAYRLVDPDSSLDMSRENIPLTIDLLFFRPARLEAPFIRHSQGDMAATFGNLQPWDRYFIGSSDYVNYAFFFYNVGIARGYDILFSSLQFGRMFLKNVVHVQTFITNAAYDLMIYSDALAPALGMHSDILVSSRHRTQEPAGTQRPGLIILDYQPSAFPGIPGPGTRNIRFPLYQSSGHAVSLNQPVDLYNDVSSWLSRAGIDIGGEK